MTISTSNYTVGDNYPLNHARILWSPITGTITGEGTDPDLAGNDFTAQRWTPGAGSQNWTITVSDAGDAQPVDCVFIAAHNLAGTTVTVSTNVNNSPVAFTSRAVVPVTDNSPVCIMFNEVDGATPEARRVRVNIADGTGRTVGIIRAGEALQMQQPFYSGHTPLNLSRVTEAQQQFSEGGQWLGRQLKRRAVGTDYSWSHITHDWYRANFEPFAQSVPLNPFGIAGNPLRFPDDVGWVWTSSDLKPSTMGVNEYMQVDMSVTGYGQ